MKPKVETFSDAASFLAAQRGTRRTRKTAQAPAGQGDHLTALMRLSAAGWHAYTCWAGQHWFSKLDGTVGPMAATYEAAIAATEALGKEGQ